MTDKEKIRAYIIARMDDEQEAVEEFDRLGAKESAGVQRSLLGNNAAIVSFIDSIQEEPVSEPHVKKSAKVQHINETCKESGNSLTQEPVSEDLEEEIKRYCNKNGYTCTDDGVVYTLNEQIVNTARHFSEWQKQQMEAYRIKHCNNITNEQAELESDFVSKHVEKNNRLPTFLDAIEYGMELQKNQMMKDAVKGTVKLIYRDSVNVESIGFSTQKYGLFDGDEVEIIIIKKDR